MSETDQPRHPRLLSSPGGDSPPDAAVGLPGNVDQGNAARPPGELLDRLRQRLGNLPDNHPSSPRSPRTGQVHAPVERQRADWAERADVAGSATDREPPEWAEMADREPAGREPAGWEPARWEPTTAERAGSERAGSERAGWERAGWEPVSPDQELTEQVSPETLSPNQEPTEQISPEQAGTGSGGLDSGLAITDWAPFSPGEGLLGELPLDWTDTPEAYRPWFMSGESAAPWFTGPDS